MSYYMNSWQDTPLPVIPITDERVNFFAEYDVTMAAIGGSALPLGTFKFLAGLGLFQFAKLHGILQKGTKLVEASSGEMAYVFTQVGPAFGIPVEDMTFIMKLDVPAAKRTALLVAGAKVETSSNPIETARQRGGGWIKDGWKVGPGNTLNLDQYACPWVKTLYRDWAVPSIVKTFGRFDHLVCPVGTGGTVVGLNEGFQKYAVDRAPVVVGAMCADGEEVPGMRDLEGMKLISQPWEKAITHRAEVQRKPSFLCVPWLQRATDGLSVGPSGGATYVAACMFLQKLLDEGKEEQVRGKRILFVVHDHVLPYLADRFTTEFSEKSLYPPTASLPKKLIFG
jgi:cysteine synthase